MSPTTFVEMNYKWEECGYDCYFERESYRVPPEENIIIEKNLEQRERMETLQKIFYKFAELKDGNQLSVYNETIDNAIKMFHTFNIEDIPTSNVENSTEKDVTSPEEITKNLVWNIR